MQRWGLMCLIAGAVAAGPALAETLQERVAAAQRRWAEYQEMMESSDPIARSEGFNAALADENLGVRNNALWAYLHKRDRLPLEIPIEPGARVGPGDIPNVALSNVKWNADQRALEAHAVSFNVPAVNSLPASCNCGIIRCECRISLVRAAAALRRASRLLLIESARPPWRPARTAARSKDA